jgi:hypothetical protein
MHITPKFVHTLAYALSTHYLDLQLYRGLEPEPPGNDRRAKELAKYAAKLLSLRIGRNDVLQGLPVILPKLKALDLQQVLTLSALAPDTLSPDDRNVRATYRFLMNLDISLTYIRESTKAFQYKSGVTKATDQPRTAVCRAIIDAAGSFDVRDHYQEHKRSPAHTLSLDPQVRLHFVERLYRKLGVLVTSGVGNLEQTEQNLFRQLLAFVTREFKVLKNPLPSLTGSLSGYTPSFLERFEEKLAPLLTFEAAQDLAGKELTAHQSLLTFMHRIAGQADFNLARYTEELKPGRLVDKQQFHAYVRTPNIRDQYKLCAEMLTDPSKPSLGYDELLHWMLKNSGSVGPGHYVMLCSEGMRIGKTWDSVASDYTLYPATVVEEAEAVLHSVFNSYRQFSVSDDTVRDALHITEQFLKWNPHATRPPHYDYAHNVLLRKTP